MTFADDFASEEQGLKGDYPSAFGITFTPLVIGITIAVAGLALAGYGFINSVKPAQEKYEQASAKKQELQIQLDKTRAGDLQLKLAQLQSDLADRKVLRSRVISMFTSEKDLETLLIDVNNFVAANQASLIDYKPDSNISTVSDSSLGSEVQGKLKRKGISLTIEGTFTDTKQILQDLERLQPLLMIQSISSSVDENPTAIFANNNTEIVAQKQAILNTKIKLDAILPSSQAELERAKKAEEKAQAEELSDGKRKRRNRKK